MSLTHLPIAGLVLLVSATLPVAAADRDHPDHIPRLGVQVLAGTSGIEPGAYAEWRIRDADLQLRPEVFINEDGKVGAGGAIAWEPSFINLPDRHALAFGPRVVYHNSDESGWEVDLLAIWSFDLVPSQHGRHYLEVIGAVGVLEDQEEDGDDEESVVGASIGIGYGFQF